MVYYGVVGMVWYVRIGDVMVCYDMVYVGMVCRVILRCVVLWYGMVYVW